MSDRGQDPYGGELRSIEDRYARRESHEGTRYMPGAQWPVRLRQGLELGVARALAEANMLPLINRRILEVGCGGGANLLMFLGLGADPRNIVGNDLLTSRVSRARRILPAETQILEGNAADLDLPSNSFDILFQSTVFSSILDDHLLRAVAERMWSLVRPGGGVLSYDLAYSNPSNRDVRAVSRTMVRQLFPAGQVRARRITLAPPIGRVVTRMCPTAYPFLEAIPLIRTHLLCWVQKR